MLYSYRELHRRFRVFLSSGASPQIHLSKLVSVLEALSPYRAAQQPNIVQQPVLGRVHPSLQQSYCPFIGFDGHSVNCRASVTLGDPIVVTAWA